MAQKFPRNGRLADDSPRGDVQRRNVVRRPSEAAGHALKTLPAWPVSFVQTSASRAGVGCSPRLHGHNWDSSECRLVLDEAPQLPETPRVVAAALSLPNRCLASDASQVFEGEHPASVYGLRHQTLGDVVVGIPSEPLFPAREPLEVPLCALGSAPLELDLQLFAPTHDFVHPLALVHGSVGVHGEVDDAQVNTENANGVVWSWFWGIDHDSEVEHAFSEQEVGLPVNPVHAGFLVVADADGHTDSPVEGQDRGLFESLPREDALVVDHRAVGSELGHHGLVPLVGLAHLSDCPNCHLSRESKFFSELPIHEGLESHLVCRAIFERYRCDEITGLIEAVHSLDQSIELLLRRVQLGQECLLHSWDYIAQYIKRYRQFLPPLKWGASLAVGL